MASPLYGRWPAPASGTAGPSLRWRVDLPIVASCPAPVAAVGFDACRGTIQRGVLILCFAWQFSVALRLRRRASRSPP
jgi:hypothetical protein